jgi:hypothetical protein
MTTLRLRLARIALALGIAAACWACNAPFIPIPPPQQTTSFRSEIVTDGTGAQKTIWYAHGDANPNTSQARVLVFNSTIGKGVIAEAADDGSYDSQAFDGTKNDRIEISFETPAGALSGSACFLLTSDVPSAPMCQ